MDPERSNTQRRHADSCEIELRTRRGSGRLETHGPIASVVALGIVGFIVIAFVVAVLA